MAQHSDVGTGVGTVGDPVTGAAPNPISDTIRQISSIPALSIVAVLPERYKAKTLKMFPRVLSSMPFNSVGSRNLNDDPENFDCR
jgi:hypothetical protein